MRKFIPIILILVILAGIVVPSPMNLPVAEAANCTGPNDTDPNCVGQCNMGTGGSLPSIRANCPTSQWQWNNTTGSTPPPSQLVPLATPQPPEDDADSTNSEFYQSLNSCNILKGANGFMACIVKLVYGLLIGVLTFLLWISAKFFDFMAFMTLSSDMYALSFINQIWEIVRNFANIFFILILLYAAMQLILGIGHDSRKMVVWVIMMAILINFSLFFTRVIVDASNIVGLVFYNRIDTSGIRNESIGNTTSGGESNLAAALTNRFKINNFFTDTTIKTIIDNSPTGAMTNILALSLIFVYALVVGPLVYAFFIAGFAFLSRMITLMMLMIISPFAFMSYALPALSNQKLIGFKSWWHKLISSAFSIAIFMFILYVISVILEADIFAGIDHTRGTAALLISIFVPGALMVMLLLAGLKFTKEAASDFTDKIMGAGKALAGFGLGVATGGAAFALTKGVGGAAQRIANNDELRRKAAGGEGISKEEQAKAQKTLGRANYFASKSFDIRQTGLGKFAAKKAGVDLEKSVGWIGPLNTEATKGGAKKQEEKQTEKLQAKAKTYEMSEGSKMRRTGEIETWERKYNADLNHAKEVARHDGEELDEKAFRKDYERGANLYKYGFGKDETRSARPEAVEKENSNRRRAYAVSQQEKNKKARDRNAFQAGWDGVKEGIKAAHATPKGLAVTGSLAIATGGASIPITIVGAGILNGLKELIKQASYQAAAGVANTSFLGGATASGIRDALAPGLNDELLAAIRKGESSEKWLKDALKDLKAGKNVDEEKVAKGLGDVVKGSTAGDGEAKGPPAH